MNKREFFMNESFIKTINELELLNSKLASGEFGIPLWSVPRTTGEFLKVLVLSRKVRTILELGTSGGYSTLWLASGARENRGHVFTVDKEESKMELAKNFFVKAGLDSFITQFSGDISQVLKSWNKSIDLLFIDADKRNYLSYFKTLEGFFSKGTIIVADNASTHKNKMKDYNDYVTNSKNYHSFLLELDNGLLVSIRK